MKKTNNFITTHVYTDVICLCIFNELTINFISTDNFLFKRITKNFNFEFSVGLQAMHIYEDMTNLIKYSCSRLHLIFPLTNLG